jgi:hypothetical protein
MEMACCPSPLDACSIWSKAKYFPASGVPPDNSLEAADSMFRFGNFLEVCDSLSDAKFKALWADKLEAATKTVEYGKDPYAEYCKEGIQRLDYTATGFALYLTHAGLAVHNASFWPNMARHCLLLKSAINPMIIPYRELEPFMKPGPWRDELLGRKL